MRTLRSSLVGTVILVLLGAMAGAVLAQEEEATVAVDQETVFDLLIPSRALPNDFVKLVVEQWSIQASTDLAGSPVSVLGNEALRGRGLYIDGGGLLIAPATDALLWRGASGEPETTPAGEPVTLAVGDAIFLPAVPDAEVDTGAPIGIANPGREVATALSFHTHQQGGVFFGFPMGLTLGDWDASAGFDPDALAAFDGVDVLLRLSRLTGEPGATIPLPDAPTVAMYFVEAGNLEQFVSGARRDRTWTYDAGHYFQPQPGWPVTVAGDGPASVLELAAVPQPTAE